MPASRCLLPVLLCFLPAFFPAPLPGQDPQHKALEETLRILSKSRPPQTGRINALDKTWEDWQRRTGELPPRFDSMPSMALLPDPLEGVRTLAQWQERRKQIRAHFEKWFYGRMPPAPGNTRGKLVQERREGAVTIRDVVLEFGPGERGRLRLQLLIPPGKGPFPVFLTNHPRTRPWVSTAVRRGYIGCIYFAADPMYGNEDDSDRFIELYPEYDFSCLARWAWAAMRAVDYLVTLPLVEAGKIGITGHSRNGKQALLAAAFDERIGAVVASSGNTGEGNPWRYTTDMFRAESIEQITGNFPHWFHPRLRFFAGREHKLPVDQNSLFSLVAPRGLLLYSAYSEHQGNSWGLEQGYRSARAVYEFLGKPGNIGLHLRAGEHATTAADIENYVDFFDSVFGRSRLPAPETWVHDYSFERWRKLSGESIDAATFQPLPSAADNVRWALGEEPAAVTFPARNRVQGSSHTNAGWLAILHRRPFESKVMKSTTIGFGDDLAADLYYPPSGTNWPLVVWLHSYSYSTGYSRYTRPTFESLVKRGFAVLAFDQIGFGTRVLDARRFYDRYPHWSLLGKMVADTRAAIAAAAALEEIDSSRITLAGYALGGKVALFTAAMEPRVKTVAVVAAFTTLRTAAGEGIEGIRHYSHLHGLLPRLGFFLGQESRIPFDYDDLLRLIAPRPVLVVAPQLDRYAPVDDVRRCTSGLSHVELRTPLDFNRCTREREEEIFDWIAQQSR